MKDIAVAEFRARNIKENPMTKVYVRHENGHYYYIAYNGRLSTRYNSLAEAKADIQSTHGKWYDFRLLV
jgi:hypothetical protein